MKSIVNLNISDHVQLHEGIPKEVLFSLCLNLGAELALFQEDRKYRHFRMPAGVMEDMFRHVTLLGPQPW